MPEHQQVQQSTESKSNAQKQVTTASPTQASNPFFIIQRAKINPKSLTHADIMQLQRTIGNRAVGRLLSGIGLIPSKSKQAPPVQMQTIPEEEEKPLQGKMIEPIQRQEIPELEEEEPPLQGKFENKPQQETCPSCSTLSIQRETENRTGMPDSLKAGVESLSGIDMSDVRVHYNSSKPAEVGALAYTQGTNIHVAPGQEKHLPHEAWHVVQQAQGRVRPTMQLKDGVSVNDDEGMEHEADVMGGEASQMKQCNQYFTDKTFFKSGRLKLLPITRDSKQFKDIVQGKCLSGPHPDAIQEPIAKWTVKLNGQNYSMPLVEVNPLGESNRTWRLELLDNQNQKLGHIYVYYFEKENLLKPDGLEVPVDRGHGYGATLGKYSVHAIAHLKTNRIVNVQRVFLNLVNPISAHISIKELNLTLNEGDPMDRNAVDNAQAAIGSPEIGEGKLYRKAEFPNFWGRLIYLSKHNEVRFLCRSLPANLGPRYESTPEDAQNMLREVLRSKAGTFGMNIEATLPQ